jgi:hypothetical protein
VTTSYPINITCSKIPFQFGSKLDIITGISLDTISESRLNFNEIFPTPQASGTEDWMYSNATIVKILNL